MSSAEVIRSSTPLVTKSFRAVREAGETDYELKDGNQVFGSLVLLPEGHSVRCVLGGVRHVFAAESAKQALDIVACYAFLPRTISDLKKEIADLKSGVTGMRFRLFSVMRSGLDEDLLREQFLRDSTRNLAAVQALFEDARLRVEGRAEPPTPS